MEKWRRNFSRLCLIARDETFIMEFYIHPRKCKNLEQVDISFNKTEVGISSCPEEWMAWPLSTIFWWHWSGPRSMRCTSLWFYITPLRSRLLLSIVLIFLCIFSDGDTVWEREIQTHADHFHHVHMVGTVPPYRDLLITQPVEVSLIVKNKLKISEPYPFKYTPGMSRESSHSFLPSRFKRRKSLFSCSIDWLIGLLMRGGWSAKLCHPLENGKKSAS